MTSNVPGAVDLVFFTRKPKKEGEQPEWEERAEKMRLWPDDDPSCWEIGRRHFGNETENTTISRNHLTFKWMKGKWYVIDHSSCGTLIVRPHKASIYPKFVGLAKNRATPVKIGDVLHLGFHKGRVEIRTGTITLAPTEDVPPEREFAPPRK